jgi:hypothetical protein
MGIGSEGRSVSARLHLLRGINGRRICALLLRGQLTASRPKRLQRVDVHFASIVRLARSDDSAAIGDFGVAERQLPGRAHGQAIQGVLGQAIQGVLARHLRSQYRVVVRNIAGLYDSTHCQISTVALVLPVPSEGMLTTMLVFAALAGRQGEN